MTRPDNPAAFRAVDEKLLKSGIVKNTATGCCHFRAAGRQLKTG